MSVVYFDCFSGAAGDMILGALLDAGAPETDVRKCLDALGLPGWDLSVREVKRGALRALRAEVAVEHPEPARTYPAIVRAVTEAPLPGGVRTRALRTFEALAGAEARVHGGVAEDVHLHEIGATDALIDIVGSCAALEAFAPEQVGCSPVATGSGTVATAHGIMPVPVPAVTELLTGVPVLAGGDTELTTPTGAALLVANCSAFGSLPAMTITASGYGAGERDTQSPNVLRALVGDQGESGAGGAGAAEAHVLEANIDDMSPELLPHAIERLLEAGAQDAWITPIVMKKGRPAATLSVLAGPGDVNALARIVFEETTTLGVRHMPVEKMVLDRSTVSVRVEEGTVEVKVGYLGNRPVTLAPEFDDVAAIARATRLPVRVIYEAARTRALEYLAEDDSK